MKYFAKITKQNSKTYFVEFPELKGCFTEGNSLSEAKKNAWEALNGWLESVCNTNLKIPLPKIRKSKFYYPVEVELPIALAIILKKRRKDMDLTQAQMSRKLGITLTSYAKLENPTKINPTLSTLKKLSQTLNIKFDFHSVA